MGAGSCRPIRSNMKYKGASTSTPQMPAIQKTILANFIWTLALLSANGEAVDADGGRGHAATKFQIAPYLGNIAEHVFEVAGDRDLFDRIGQFAVDDPHARRSTGVIAGY